MHLGNSIICPVTGIPMIIAAGAAAYYAFKKSRKDFTGGKNGGKIGSKIFSTVVVTAFVFALQMINFSIPTTGSSGHIVGGILLAALLGPAAGFLAMCAILLVQGVFFADGGLLALGCNIFNMGFLACFVAYPFIFKPLSDRNKPVLASILASVVALQLGSLAVTAEAWVSGTLTSHPAMFAGLMQGIHLAIGLVEGVFTAAVVVRANRTNLSLKFSYALSALSLILAGFVAQYASTKPDGLEWSLLNMSESFTYQTQGYLYSMFELVQTKTAVLANLPTLFANISGLVLLAVLMFGVCSVIMFKNGEYGKQ